MKSSLRILAVTVGLCFAATGYSQTPAPATKPGAAAPGAAATAPAPHAAKESPAAPRAPMEKAGAAPAPKAAAAGGGAGKVWVSKNSKAYHCAGTKLYGKTKDGQYMTEAEAKAKGYHAEHGNTCAK